MAMKKPHARRLFAHLLLSLGALTMIFPFIWMISTSFKDVGEVFVFPPTLFGEKLQWENYLRISDRFPFGQFFFNSLKVTLIVVAAQLITSSLA